MPRLETPICDLFGLAYPIAQAPIGSVSTPELAAAVSNAGGLGTLAVTWQGYDATRETIERTAALTDRPFAVNLVLDDATTIHPTEEHLEVCLEAGAPIVTFSFGDPAPYVATCHDADVPVIAMVGSADEASDAASAGVDALVAQGWEAGGHLGSDVATTSLVPRVADAVDVPVFAAGGIGDGRGIAASIALGADGAWLGTRFVATREADAHETYKRAVVAARETETVRSQVFDGGWPGRDHRTLENDVVREWKAAGRPPPGDRPGEDEQVAETADGRTVRRYDDLPPIGGVEGDAEALPQYAGQSAGTTGTVDAAGDVVETLVAETVAAAGGLSDAVGEE